MVKLHLITLGCARNQVDSEIMTGLLKNAGCTLTTDPSDAEIIIVNTCSFIESAAQESIDTILELATLKEEGACRRLIVAGCLPERYREELIQQLPEVDLFLGTGAYDRIADAVKEHPISDICWFPPPDSRPPDSPCGPRLTTSFYTAYLKVAEGCSRQCTYCIIPKLRGRQRSRPLENILLEAGTFIESGAKELNLVAQDTTSWGYDLNPPRHPAELIKALAKMDGKAWIRILYGHPDRFDDRLIDAIGQEPTVLSYFDIPIQHVSSRILKKMGRNYTRKHLSSLFQKIRDMVSDAVLRTTLIVGFPGETQKDMKELIDFVEETRFDHLGVFTYSDENDLPSHHLPDHVSQKTAKNRLERIMRAQAHISEKNNEKHMGCELDVLVEEAPEDGLLIGRTWFQAPDVDGITYIRTLDQTMSEPFDRSIGSVVRVKITDTAEYDLFGVLL